MQAIILAAGAGTRLRGVAPIKPLAIVGGKPLVQHALEGLSKAGATETIVVLGYEHATVAAVLVGLDVPCRVRTVVNDNWDAPNGLSVLAAAPFVAGRALLTMCDHLADPALYAAVAASPQGTTLGIDRRIGHPWVDEDDVTRVATKGSRITAIGKALPVYDAYDTGVFNLGPGLFEALRASARPSLSDGMTRLAAAGTAFAVDTGELAWLDVDDDRAFEIAETWRAVASEPA